MSAPTPTMHEIAGLVGRVHHGGCEPAVLAGALEAMGLAIARGDMERIAAVYRDLLAAEPPVEPVEPVEVRPPTHHEIAHLVTTVLEGDLPFNGAQALATVLAELGCAVRLAMLLPLGTGQDPGWMRLAQFYIGLVRHG